MIDLDQLRRLHAEKANAGKLSMWTVYERPDDYPESYVARLYDMEAGGAVATANIIVTPDLEMMRSILAFELHLTAMARSPGDDAYIVETWF